jgi:UV excision repair protein RAD23
MTLQELIRSPQGEQMRQLVQQNPQLIQPLIQQIAGQNPALAQAIATNPEMLFQLLAGEEGEGEEGAGGQLPPGAHVIELTPAEREAVGRVRTHSFTRILGADVSI